MIKSLRVRGLNNRIDGEWEFNEDLNVITGKNGSGKTTLLKLLWYLISGNLKHIILDIPFQSVSIETDAFSLAIGESHDNQIGVESSFLGEEGPNGSGTIEEFEKHVLEELSRKILNSTNGSLFFPTFRRNEGGYSGEGTASITEAFFLAGLEWSQSDQARGRFTDRAMERLKEAMSHLSNGLSVRDHRFIASISTHDIVELLSGKYTDISYETNALHVQLYKDITQKIAETKGGDDATRVLDDIQERVEQATQKREALLRPFSILTERIHDIFQYKGIRVTQEFTLGEAEEAIASDKLSSGEKQMLSFLCYNAFSENTPIFVDEPELSLHVDWQRLLLPTLLEQGTGNQFFIATHSPFIYAKYPDKEILLGDKGGTI